MSRLETRSEKPKSKLDADDETDTELSTRQKAVLDPLDRFGLGGLVHWPSWFGRHMPEWVPSDFDGIRVETYLEDDTMVVRAEIPGVEPDDIEISVDDEQLTIEAERQSRTDTEDNGFRSEFRYGSFVRVLTLPKDAKADDIEASYDDGILQVVVPVEDRVEREAIKIPISRS